MLESLNYRDCNPKGLFTSTSTVRVISFSRRSKYLQVQQNRKQFFFRGELRFQTNIFQFRLFRLPIFPGQIIYKCVDLDLDLACVACYLATNVVDIDTISIQIFQISHFAWLDNLQMCRFRFRLCLCRMLSRQSRLPCENGYTGKQL